MIRRIKSYVSECLENLNIRWGIISYIIVIILQNTILYDKLTDNTFSILIIISLIFTLIITFDREAIICRNILFIILNRIISILIILIIYSYFGYSAKHGGYFTINFSYLNEENIIINFIEYFFNNKVVIFFLSLISTFISFGFAILIYTFELVIIPIISIPFLQFNSFYIFNKINYPKNALKNNSNKTINTNYSKNEYSEIYNKNYTILTVLNNKITTRCECCKQLLNVPKMDKMIKVKCHKCSNKFMLYTGANDIYKKIFSNLINQSTSAYSNGDFNIAMFKCRQLNESVIKEYFRATKNIRGNELIDNINFLKNNNIIDNETCNMMHFIRLKGNKAAHENYNCKEDAQLSLEYSKKVVDNINNFIF